MLHEYWIIKENCPHFGKVAKTLW